MLKLATMVTLLLRLFKHLQKNYLKRLKTQTAESESVYQALHGE